MFIFTFWVSETGDAPNIAYALCTLEIESIPKGASLEKVNPVYTLRTMSIWKFVKNYGNLSIYDSQIPQGIGLNYPQFR